MLEAATQAEIEKCITVTFIQFTDMGFIHTPSGVSVPTNASCQPYDLAWLFYTSGTRGHPKGVLIIHGML
ncbi:AMP-binding protein [Paracoccaceae bacterium]|nr:AMP-binding protein [Paracoccaceae bacterium]